MVRQNSGDDDDDDCNCDINDDDGALFWLKF